MREIDLTLGMLKVPALAGYDAKVGTFIDATAENKGCLTAAQVADNVALPWTRSRPVQISESCVLSRADYDARIMAVTPGITITLGGASYAGCTITVYACIDGGSVMVETESDSKPVSAGCSASFMWNGEKFVLATFTSGGGSGAVGGSSFVQPYKNGVELWNFQKTPMDIRVQLQETKIYACGNASVQPSSNKIIVSGIKQPAFDYESPNKIVIKVKLNNTINERKTFFLQVNAMNREYSARVWAAWACEDITGSGIDDTNRLVGFSTSVWIYDKDLAYPPYCCDMLNRQAVADPARVWIPFDILIGNSDSNQKNIFKPDADGYIYIGLTFGDEKRSGMKERSDSDNIFGWGIADRNSEVRVTDCISSTFGTGYTPCTPQPVLSSNNPVFVNLGDSLFEPVTIPLDVDIFAKGAKAVKFGFIVTPNTLTQRQTLLNCSWRVDDETPEKEVFLERMELPAGIPNILGANPAVAVGAVLSVEDIERYGFLVHDTGIMGLAFRVTNSCWTFVSPETCIQYSCVWSEPVY